jgi:REP element-mobilizing transposase RayT
VTRRLEFVMGYQFRQQEAFHCFFVTTSFHEHKALGNLPGMYEQLALCLEFCLTKYNAQLTGYVFMPTHLHLILFINGNKLGPLMRDFKKYIAQKVCPDLEIKTLPVWEEGFDRVAIISSKVLQVKLEYIHRNPVKAGIVGEDCEWKWSSASAYWSESDGPLPICRLWME